MLTSEQKEAKRILERAYRDKNKVRVEFIDGSSKEGFLSNFQKQQQAAVHPDLVPVHFSFQDDERVYGIVEIARASAMQIGGG